MKILILWLLAVCGVRLVARLLGWSSEEPPELWIAPHRVSLEETRLRRIQLDIDDDPGFREQVKRRMLEGVKCEIEPWFSNGRPTRRKLPRNSIYVN